MRRKGAGRGRRDAFGLFAEPLRRPFNLKLAQDVEGAEVGAPGGIDAALEAQQEFFIGLVAFGEASFVAAPGFVRLLDDLAFDGAETAEAPLVGDEGIDQAALVGSVGGEAVVVFDGERFELLGGPRRRGRGEFGRRCRFSGH